VTGPSLGDLAASFRGECRALRSRDLVPACGEQWASALPGRLGAIADRLGAGQVTVTFGGHFSSGKSTVINALLGRPLLPTSDYPETGVPCTITAGPADRAVALHAGRTEVLTVSAEAIARVVSLIDSRGSYRADVGTVTRVEVTLGGSVLPSGLVLIDSPGINDTAAMTERAAATAARADILVWVVNSQQALSETEQWFLAEHVTGDPADCVVLVVNAFLTADTADRWNWFLRERAPAIRARIEGALRRGGDDAAGPPEILFMSARAGAASPAGFGTAGVRELVTGLSLQGNRLRAARLSRAVAELSVVISELQERIRQEQKRQQRARAELDKQQEADQRRRQECGRVVTRDIAAAFARYRAAAEDAVTATVSDIGGSLQRDGGHGRDMTSRLNAVAGQIAAAVIADLTRDARQHALPAPSAETGRKVRSALAPAAISITVPNNPAVSTRKGGRGAVIGGILGSIVAPGVGTMIGAAVGGALGSAAGNDGAASAIAADRAGAQANARSAGDAAVSALAGKQESVRRLVLADPCFNAPMRAAAADDTTLKALRNVHTRLSRTRDTWRRQST
jgi:predicted GTPase